MHAQLAQDYYQLCTLDAQKKVLDETVVAYKKFLELTKNRYATGVAAQSDILTAQTQLDTAEAQDIRYGRPAGANGTRDSTAHGQGPIRIDDSTQPPLYAPPPVPAGIPSELLERRPDIAAAERQAASANALIGVAESAYFPTVTLGTSGGFEAAHFLPVAYVAQSNLDTRPGLRSGNGIRRRAQARSDRRGLCDL